MRSAVGVTLKKLNGVKTISFEKHACFFRQKQINCVSRESSR